MWSGVSKEQLLSISMSNVKKSGNKSDIWINNKKVRFGMYVYWNQFETCFENSWKISFGGKLSKTQSLFWLWEKGFPIYNTKMVTFTPDRNRWPWKYSSIPYKGAIDLFLKWYLTKWSGSQILLLQKLLRLTNPPSRSTRSQIGSKEIICSKLDLVVLHQKKLQLIVLKLVNGHVDRWT